MRILVAEDTQTLRALLDKLLTGWGHEVVCVEDGQAALEALQQPGAPPLAILDWIMPKLDGAEVCRLLREQQDVEQTTYLILLTSKKSTSDVVDGLQAGADDFLSKPVNWDELHARINVGCRVIALQKALAERVKQLEAALAELKTLRGLIKICMHCHRILTDETSWQKLETYIEIHSEATFTHGICPVCFEKHHPLKGKGGDPG
jgi:DNA-binding response OmpR family regulator